MIDIKYISALFYTKTTRSVPPLQSPSCVGRGHDARDRVHVDLLRDLLRLDLLVLAGDEHVARRLARLLPPVLLDPLQGVNSIEKL